MPYKTEKINGLVEIIYAIREENKCFNTDTKYMNS